LTERRKALLKDPEFFAVILGVILGLVCEHLPDTANGTACLMTYNMLEEVEAAHKLDGMK
jgi:hypothetical protein